MAALPTVTSFFGPGLMLGFGRLSIMPPIIIGAQGFWAWDYHFHLGVSHSLSGCSLILTLIAFGGTGNHDVTSFITHYHNINLLLLYFAPSEVDTTY